VTIKGSTFNSRSFIPLTVGCDIFVASLFTKSLFNYFEICELIRCHPNIRTQSLIIEADERNFHNSEDISSACD